MNRFLFFILLLPGLLFANEEKWAKLGGLFQPQYRLRDNQTSSTDDLRFRRLRLILSGSVDKDWKASAMFDFGLQNTAIRGAYLLYKGIDQHELRIGSTLARFSRESLTSNTYQFLVERTFTGDHNYGTPLFNTGLHLYSKKNDGAFSYATTLAIASHDPDEKKLDLEDPIQIDKGKDWSDGLFISGRVAWHPWGPIPNKQDFLKRYRRLSLEIGAYTWNNDSDNLMTGGHSGGSGYDVDSITGLEMVMALRYEAFALDLAHNRFDAKLVDPSITSGLYLNSETELKQLSAELGFAVLKNKLDLVAGYEHQDADNYSKAWTKSSLGFVHYIKGHDIKVMGTASKGDHVDGVAGNELDEFLLMFQFKF
jgi:phosphate-selective porin OprO and OprP